MLSVLPLMAEADCVIAEDEGRPFSADCSAHERASPFLTVLRGSAGHRARSLHFPPRSAVFATVGAGPARSGTLSGRLAWVGDDHGVYLLRISLPDRPGSLGSVATALGEAGVNIHAMEIVERAGGSVVHDFLVRLTPDRLIDSIVAACHRIPGVSVVWVSRYPSDGNLQSDLETLERMTKDPPHAAEILLTASPIVFRAHWALLVSVSPAPTVSLGTAMAPELDGQGLARFGSFDTIHRVELNDGWQPGWAGATAAVAPLAGDQALVVGRQGGPPFLNSELARIGHIAALA